MSKHFELLQQIDTDQIVSEPLVPLTSSSKDLSESRSQPARWATDETLRLVQKIFLLPTQPVPQAVVFAGVDHGNGSSQISASVAEMLSVDTARPVCLVEANFRSPGLANLFQVAPTPGLTDSLVHPEPLGTFARAVGQNLWLLTAGTITANSASLLSSDRLRERLTELRNTFDFIVIDAPPLSQYSDATMLGKLSDGLVIVIEADSTRKKVASAVTETLRSLHIPILAAVLNKRTFPIPKAIYKRM